MGLDTLLFIFYQRNSQLSDLFSTPMALKTCSGQICNDSVQLQIEIRKISRRCSRSSDYVEFGHFTFLFGRGRQKKCTKIYNARAQLLFFSLNLLFGDVVVAIVVVVCLSSLVI